MVNNSNRINVLCFGIADYLLADTIMLVSLIGQLDGGCNFRS